MRVYENIYCDKDIVVVGKAPDVPSHGLEGKSYSLIDAVAQEFPEVLVQFPGDREGGLCHRLDNGTSGIVVIARHPTAREKFRKLFLEGKIEKTYLAIVKGRMPSPFEVHYPIAHHAKNARKMVAMTSPTLRHRSHPKDAVTLGKVLLNNDGASLVRVTIGAGRRHQVRVHLASVGHPLIGDALYGGPNAEYLTGHALHAATLVLPSGESLESHCPAEWDDELKRLGLTS
jgi:23S rRNA pseudouridine1911/1915/1917 synthase